MRELVAAILVLQVIAGPAVAAGMKLERDRLANLEGPDTVGLFKVRFDFQHNFKDYTLLPIADLVLAAGVWHSVQIQAETLLHNEDTLNQYGTRNVFQFNVVEYGAKWAILDQTQEDWFSLAVGGAIGRSDVKYATLPPPAGSTRPNPTRYHLNNRSAWGVAHWDSLWFSQYLTVKWVEYLDTRTNPGVVRSNRVTTPGIGERIKAWESKDLKIHVIADFQPFSFDNRYSANAWGAGLQFMWGSPHIFTFFVSNTHGATASESVFGSRSFDPARNRAQDVFYNFRWSYRF